MKKLKILIVPLMVLLIAGCGKDDDDTEPSNKTCQLTKMTTGQIKLEFQYNAAGKVTRINSSHLMPANNGYSEFIYDATGTLTELRVFDANNVLVNREVFSFNQMNLPDTIYYLTGMGSPTPTDGFTTYQYNGARQLVKASSFSNQQASGPTTYSDITYPGIGQVIEKFYGQDAAGNMQLEVTTDYQFDDKPNPFSGWEYHNPRVQISPNNNIARQATYHTGGFSYSETSTFTFNSEGYPISSTSTSTLPNSTPRIETYEYNCF